MSARLRREPCEACPYRCDVPPAVWEADEYEKLVAYDAETFDQPFAAFACHASPSQLCHGWAVVHTRRGQSYDLLALRICGLSVAEVDEHATALPLFASGADAAAHGRSEPTDDTHDMIDRLQLKHRRLRGPQ